MICVRCYKEIPKNEGYVIVEGRASPEVPCCVDCYNKSVDAHNDMLNKAKIELLGKDNDGRE